MWALRAGPWFWRDVLGRSFRHAPGKFVWGVVAYLVTPMVLLGFGTSSWIIGVVAGGTVGLLCYGAALLIALDRVPNVVHDIGPLRTDRLLLSQSTAADVDAVVATVDDQVVEVNGWPADERANLRRMLRLPPGAHKRWLVTVAETGEVVGSIACNRIDREAGTADLGWWIGPTGRGKGYATEAVAAVLAALHGAGVRRVEFGTETTNLPVRRILEKVGAVLEEERPHTLPNGRVIAGTRWTHEAG